MPGCIVSATTANFSSVEKRRLRATPVITSTFENVSDIGTCLGLFLGPPGYRPCPVETGCSPGRRTRRYDQPAQKRWRTGVDLNDVRIPKANLSDADLSGANLHRADLSEASLYDTNLSGAFLNGANLRGAGLADANLSGAYFVLANLRGANLHG